MSTRQQRSMFRVGISIPLLAALIFGGYGANSAVRAAHSGASTVPPYVVHTSWGTFRLSNTVAQKIRNHQPINYVFSYQGTGIPLFSTQYLDGFNAGCKAGSAIYPLNCTAIAPVQTDANQQLSQIITKLTAGQIDCLSIEPTTSNGFTSITNQIMDKGIPVFTVGVTSNGHEFTNFTQVPLKEGATAAHTVLTYMQVNHLKFKYFAVSGGDPSQFWAQGRMTGFMNTIKAAIPGAVFLNTPSTAVNTTYDPAGTYDKAKAFILGHSNLQVFENSDIGADSMDRAITDLKMKGKVFTVGWNVSKANLAAIDAGVQIGTMDQRWAEQAAFGGKACATFLATGKILPNTQVLNPVVPANVCAVLSKTGPCTTVAAARKDLERILKGG